MGLSLAGAYMGSQANQNQLAVQQNDNRLYDASWFQNQNQGNQDSAALSQQLSGLGAQRYQAMGDLANQMGSAQRYGAGQTAYGNDMAGQNALMTGTPGIQDHGGPAGRVAAITGATQQQYQPRLAAYQNALAQGQAQQAMGRYDQTAMNTEQNALATQGYQAQQAESRSQYLAAIRQQMLANEQLKYQYQGPGKGYYDTQLQAQLLGAAGQGLTSYGASSLGRQSMGAGNGGVTAPSYYSGSTPTAGPYDIPADSGASYAAMA